MSQPGAEPVIEVGLLEGSAEVRIQLEGAYAAAGGQRFGPGELQARARDGRLEIAGASRLVRDEIELEPTAPEACAFGIEARIGIDFHWQRREHQRFRGGLGLRASADGRVRVVNRVGLETYLASVVGSEMNAAAPVELARAHAIISRSWLLAQLRARERGPLEGPVAGRLETGAEIRRWTDRQAHADFDVCADDHCQRYQGIGRAAQAALAAVAATRGQALTHRGEPCDARFSKCCGGVSEDFRSAWSDEPVAYLVPVRDGPGGEPLPDLRHEAGLRAHLERPAEAYCDCRDPALLARVLNDYDRETVDFFRWRVRLSADEAGDRVRRKLGVDLGRLLAFEPLERGPSGRLVRLGLRGEAGQLVVGKELEIRRALSETHLYSSAFVCDPEGPGDRPEAFWLSGAGWGHGVGLCQIGAAVMAERGFDHRAILAHYYPGTRLERIYG